MLSLRQLRYFDAVARLRHFGRAAEHCAVTQPALSMQLREMEAELGLQLVERHARGVRLTPAGIEVARRAARILAEVRDLRDYASHSAAPLAGTLNLGVIPSVAPYLLPPLLPLIQKHYPGLDLAIRETQTRALVDQLADGSLDLLLLALPIDEPGIETAPLFEDRFLLALPPRARLDKKVRATPDLLKADRLLLLEEGHCMRDQALAFCELAQIGSINTFGASSLSTLVQMVANGMGMTLLPEISLPLELRGQDIGVTRFVEPEPYRTIGLAWRRSSPRRADFAELGRLVVKAAGREFPSTLDDGRI